MSEECSKYILLPHHEQGALCTSRLPYRQGRTLTAVKVYSINNESRHLLVFGVPSLNLRQETKALFSRFGKLHQFNTTKYPSELFTETYHAVYEDIQSARVAKKMLDTNNYYGGSLHICYAPELETVEETKEKLLQRQRNVVARLKNLQASTCEPKHIFDGNIAEEKDANINDCKVYMGHINNIQLDKSKAAETKSKNKEKHKKFKPQKSNKLKSKTNIAINELLNVDLDSIKPNNDTHMTGDTMTNSIGVISKDMGELRPANAEPTKVNECLNYNNFGKELIKQVPYKPLNKITFKLNKKD